MYCPECGNKIEEGARFCSECGTKIEQPLKRLKSSNPLKRIRAIILPVA